MKFSIGSDHAGFHHKEKVRSILAGLGHEVVDHGPDSTKSVDYPDYGLQVARDVAAGRADFGVTVCGSGNGMNMTVNRIPGVRGALVLNPEMSRLARAHNNANVLTLSEMFTPVEALEDIIVRWIETPFDGRRHERRVNKMSEIERKYCEQTDID